MHYIGFYQSLLTACGQLVIGLGVGAVLAGALPPSTLRAPPLTWSLWFPFAGTISFH